MSRVLNGRSLQISTALCAALLSRCASGPAAAIPFDAIGPGEYDLPVDFARFDGFVQYATAEDNDRTPGCSTSRTMTTTA